MILESWTLKNMIKESLEFKNNSLWFTTLVSKKENLPLIYKKLIIITVLILYQNFYI